MQLQYILRKCPELSRLEVKWDEPYPSQAGADSMVVVLDCFLAPRLLHLLLDIRVYTTDAFATVIPLL